MSNTRTVVHKQNPRPATPAVSVILLDWSVREHFQALRWLAKQDVPRELFELIWVELYDRTPPTALANADVVITCGQRGLYHKHIGYNAGLLKAQGQVVTVCDSDAVFPLNFVSSILASFDLDRGISPRSIVLMHDEWRTQSLYPPDITTLEQLSEYTWQPLWKNYGACLSVRTRDAIGFGGFDEHTSYRGFLCGPYELGWRMANAGIAELWHEPSVALWHFAHPYLPASGKTALLQSGTDWKYPGVDSHAMVAVEALATGRLLPLQENEDVHRRRLAQRIVAAPPKPKYTDLAGPHGFSYSARLRLLWWNLSRRYQLNLTRTLQALIGNGRYEALKRRWRTR